MTTAPAAERATRGTEVPESVIACSALPAIDYADHFSLSTDVRVTPEQWARAMFGDVPSPAGTFIWRVLLGLRLTRGPSPATVAGWRIGGRGADWIRLEAESWFLGANLVVHADGSHVALATFIRYRRPVGRVVWTLLSSVHRRLAPGLLRGTETKMQDRRTPA